LDISQIFSPTGGAGNQALTGTPAVGAFLFDTCFSGENVFNF
jgi:hypothetical protein